SLLCNNNKIKMLDNKNNIYHGVILFLTVFFLVLRSPQAAQSNSDRQPESTTTELEQDTTPVFGTKGAKRWYIQGAAATTLDNNESDPRRFGLVGAGLSKFFINGHSVNLELNGIYFNQPDDDAVGLNLALIMRWHFVRQQNWSLYIDGGAGIMGTTNDVPTNAASFNFTPQVGGGATIELKDQKRLMLGLRWHHISHADLFENNPGRDSIMGYIGLNFSR
ncbi:MAG: acyloxyacyl hydrolase, partial [Cyanobacteria bacterium P01_F01_bin.143]